MKQDWDCRDPLMVSWLLARNTELLVYERIGFLQDGIQGLGLELLCPPSPMVLSVVLSTYKVLNLIPSSARVKKQSRWCQQTGYQHANI